MDAETVHQAWQPEAFPDALRPVTVDITSVTEVDEHGRALLLLMHLFGAQIIAKSSDSSTITQPIVTELDGSAVAKPGWFSRLVRFFWKDRHVTFPPRAQMIFRMSTRERLTI